MVRRAVIEVADYETWRAAARQVLSTGHLPNEVHFRDPVQSGSLFEESDATPDVIKPQPGQNSRTTQGVPPSLVTVPRPFLELARKVAAYREPSRWDVLYRALWRLTHGEPHLLDLVADDDVMALGRMEKAVRRDSHKTKAFVRFRRIEDADGERYVAWHRPDHDVLPLIADFFARRFPAMRWSILTPTRSVHHEPADESTEEAARITLGPGVPETEAPTDDVLEEWWKGYYAAIFNPARIKVRAMKAEMPVRHWPTLPETELIPDLLRTARRRADEMVAKQEGSAESARNYLPTNAESLTTLAHAAKACRGCSLHHDATQVVFGQGPRTARIVLVGEQPGDQEDIAGEPFIGPAGAVLDRALAAVGLDRSTCYVTNVVKHFKFRMTGTRRLHQTPTAREMWACQPWLEEELKLIAPQVVVCLGATAAKAIISKEFRITKQRGDVIATDWCAQTLATYHPSAVLRAPKPEQRAELEAFLRHDLQSAVALLNT